MAPKGWHIPSDAEWDTLSTFLGGDAVAGGRMKSTGTIEAGTGLWHDPNKRATNRRGLKVFQQVTVAIMEHSMPLAFTVTGGVLQRTIQPSPGFATWALILSTSVRATPVCYLDCLFDV